ncbi:hypothetical protein [Prochlorococcus sp. MIT 1223]|uniref:hypothetical protein n=1 Tax=Prochlorococcus sp. MIT 1223 TaxID=3096217 RepID=UPI002A75FEDF|nr:hypothetical protein [Prochlorococcus sp. MIT 1223]
MIPDKLPRLILSSLLLVVGLQTSMNAMPWGNDLILKSKLGEKYIIKKSTLKFYKKGYENLGMAMRREIGDNKWLAKDYQKKIDNEGERDECMARERCLGYKSYDPAWTKNVKKYTEKAEEAEAFYNKNKNFLNLYRGPKIHLISINYTPIFQDINGIKTIKEEKNVSCLNPRLSSKAKELWEGVIAYRSLTSYDKYNDPPLHSAVCKKFAKF